METTSKTKRIMYMTSLLYITFMFGTFIISNPKKVLTKINCDNYIHNQTTYNTHNITDIICNCSDTINDININRYSYNIVGIILFILLIILLNFNTLYNFMLFLFIIYYVINLLFIIKIMNELNLFNSFCFNGIYNTDNIFLINFILELFIFIISSISIFITIIKKIKENNRNRYINIINERTPLPLYDDTLPPYTE